MADLPASNNPAVSVVQFADDVAVVATGRPAVANRLINNYLEEIAVFYAENGLCCNNTKSHALLVTGTLNRLDHAARREAKSIVVVMNGNRIPNVQSARYLGVSINSKWSFVEHVSAIKRKMAAIIGVMGGLLQRKHHVISAVKTTFYKTAIRSGASYGFAMWNGVSFHQMEIVRQQKGAFCAGADQIMDGIRDRTDSLIQASYIYRDAKTTRIDAWMTRSYLNAFTKMSCSDNPTIRELFDGYVHQSQVKYKQPQYWFFENERAPLFNNVGHIDCFNRRIRDGAIIYTTTQ